MHNWDAPKSLLVEERLEDERSRQFSALTAVSNMYPQETREILNAQLSDIILNRVTDENWNKVIVYLGSIDAWDNLSEPCRLKAESYIDKIEIYETQQGFYKRLSQSAIFVLIRASRITFLRDAVTKKLQISLKQLLALKETCKDDLFKETILIPILRESTSQATLDELLLMRTEPLLSLDESIQTYIKQKVKDSSLPKLASTISKHQDEWLLGIIEPELEAKIPAANLEDLLSSKSSYSSVSEPQKSLIELFDNSIAEKIQEEIEITSLEELVLLMTSYEDDFFVSSVESYLEEKILTANLEELLDTKSTYSKTMDEPKENVIKLLDESINRQVKTVSFDELLDQSRHWDEITSELIEPILKNNVSAVIDRFAKSGSFASAGSNARLLVKIAEYLSPTQWESILEAFFQNDQIYCSFSCYGGFEALFKKSLELSGSIQPYWSAFRERLNKFNDKYSNSLKRLIDSHI